MTTNCAGAGCIDWHQAEDTSAISSATEPTHDFIFATVTFTIVILSGEAAPRSEPAAESKDPCALHYAKSVPGNSPCAF